MYIKCECSYRYVVPEVLEIPIRKSFVGNSKDTDEKGIKNENLNF